MRTRAVAWSLFLFLALLLCLGAAFSPAPANALEGLVTGTGGRPLAGALVSDGHGLAVSDREGRWTLASQAGRVVSLCPPPGYAPPEEWWRPVREGQPPWRVELATAPAAAEPVLAWLSDPHLFGPQAPPLNKWSKKLDQSVPLAAWERTAKGVAAAKPDLVLVSGDLAMDAERGEPSHARAQLALAARALARLPGPVRALPGNHDVRYAAGRVDYAPWRENLGPVRHLARLGPAVLVLLDNTGLCADTSGGPRDCGALSHEALAWLHELLKVLPRNTPLILVTHYPLASPLAGSNPLFKGALVKSLAGPGLALRDTDQSLPDLGAVLAGRPIVALLNGHEHVFRTDAVFTEKGPLRMWGAPAVCGRWWYGPVERGGLKFPAGYLVGRLKDARAPLPRLEFDFRPVEFPPAAN